MMVFNRNRSHVFTSKCGPSAMSSTPSNQGALVAFYNFDYSAISCKMNGTMAPLFSISKKESLWELDQKNTDNNRL